MELNNIFFDIDEYIESINKDYSTRDATEHSYRVALKILFEKFISDGVRKESKKLNVINEPKRKDFGAPDFEIRCNDAIISFIETKDVNDDDLEGTGKNRKQFDRYKKAVNLIAFTNYLRFVLFENGEQKLSAAIGEIRDGKIVPTGDEEERYKFRQIVSSLANSNPQPIRSASVLSKTMAVKAKIIAEVLTQAMEDNKTNEDENLNTYLGSFRKFLVHDMTKEQFADFYAQTIVFGLFIARTFDKDPNTFSLLKAGNLIPSVNPFLKKIFGYLALADPHPSIGWIIEELVAIFRVTKMERVLHNYGKDPLVHFYEDFLVEYNPKIREDFGVWNTPIQVVAFIVNAVDIILREKFDIADGLADNSTMDFKGKSIHRVQILDPALGTGTFLAATAEKIYEDYKDQEGQWPGDVVEHIIPRLNGFEYLMAPYTMAHLKVAKSLRLDENKVQLPDRLNIFLTNSLEEEHPDEKLEFAKFITDESNAANKIKRDTPVMVVMGNPPYNETSANKGKWIMRLMNSYKQEPGKLPEVKIVRIRWGEDRGKIKEVIKNSLKEKNPKAINNDYCKFIRLGQEFVEKTNEGVLAYICGNTFLDTPLFRGMRYELLKKFDEIYIVNLHGSTKRKESTKERKDECVFNIQVGVSINIFIKKKGGDSNELARVFYKDVFGTQKEKLGYLSEHNLSTIDFTELSLMPPLYTFQKRSPQVREKYDEGFDVSELMKKYVQGFTTDKDQVAIQYEQSGVKAIVDAMKSDSTDDDLRKLFAFKDSRDWKLCVAREKIKEIKEKNFVQYLEENVTRVLYRPFDIRWTLFNKTLVTYPRPLLQMSVFNKDNLVLCLGKIGSAIGDSEWSLAYISTLPTDKNVIPRGGVYLFPLLVYDNNGTTHINYSIDIIRKLEKSIGMKMARNDDEIGFTPLDLLDYIYAVLHSKQYRKIYHECLQEGFPKIPYPMSKDYFIKMVNLGGKIRRLHLLEDINKKDFITSFSINGDNLCTGRSFKETGDGIGQVWINKEQYFDKVPKSAWQMIVAGNQPLDKWLKDRKDRQLTNDEINHYQKMIVALTRQIEVMANIDETIVLPFENN